MLARALSGTVFGLVQTAGFRFRPGALVGMGVEDGDVFARRPSPGGGADKPRGLDAGDRERVLQDAGATGAGGPDGNAHATRP